MCFYTLSEFAVDCFDVFALLHITVTFCCKLLADKFDRTDLIDFKSDPVVAVVIFSVVASDLIAFHHLNAARCQAVDEGFNDSHHAVIVEFYNLTISYGIAYCCIQFIHLALNFIEIEVI